MENKMKRFLSLVLALVLVGQSLPWSAQAVENTPTEPPYEETEPTESVETEPTSAVPDDSCGDNLTWSLEEGILTISGKGAMYNYSSSDPAPWYDQREDITAVVLQRGVTSVGESAFAGCVNLTGVDFVGIVTFIGEGAFDGCSSLASIEIPEGITTIETATFNGCKALKEVDMPSSMQTIGDCAFMQSGLERIKLPKSVTSIGGMAFSGAKSLRTVYFEGDLPVIESTAFLECDYLVFAYHQNNSTWDSFTPPTYGSAGISLSGYDTAGSIGFCGDHVTWSREEGVLHISGTGDMWTHYSDREVPWYNSRNHILGVVVGEGVTSLSNYALFGCKNASEMTLPESLTSLGDLCLAECYSLSALDLPDGLTYIGAEAFRNDDALTQLTMPAAVSSIGANAFNGCTALENIVFTGDAPNFDTNAFYGLTATVRYPGDNGTWTEEVRQNYGGDITWIAVSEYIARGTCGENLQWTLTEDGTLCISGTGAMEDYENNTSMPWYNYRSQIKKVVIEDGVTSIGSRAFYEHSKLEEITIPNSVESIGIYCFFQCANLKAIDLPDKLTVIQDSSLRGCSSLTELEIPETVTEIEFFALGGCDGLKTVTVPESVTELGNWAFAECEGLESVYIPDSITVLPNWLFMDCVNLKAVRLPEELTDISDAFYGCSALETLALPETVTEIGSEAFYGCSSLASVNIPAVVTSIGASAFYNCDSLTGIELPAGVTSIGNSAFYSCNKLTEIDLPAGLKTIGDHAFNGCTGLVSITVPDSVTALGSYVFSGCSNLTSVTLSSQLQSLKQGLFWQCGKLQELAIPETVTSIGNNMFYDTGLIEVILPSGVTSIGGTAFAGCDDLKRVVFQGNAPSIDATAFYQLNIVAYYPENDATWTEEKRADYGGTVSWVAGIPEDAVNSCGANLRWKLVDGVLTISGTGPMYDYSYEYASTAAPWYAERASITSLVLEEGVTTIGKCAFGYCSGLTEVVIPDSVISVGQDAFSRCNSLKRVVLGKGLKDLSPHAFNACSVLMEFRVSTENGTYAQGEGDGIYSKDMTRLVMLPRGYQGAFTIPDTVTSIADAAFSYCTKLTAVVMPDSVTGVSSNTFYNCTQLKSVILSKQLKKLSFYMFSGCTALTDIVIPEGVTEIGYSAFFNCQKLKNVTLPETLKTIGAYAFDSCINLAAITIPAGVERIESSAFRYCRNLKTVVFQGNAPAMESDYIFAQDTTTVYYPSGGSGWSSIAGKSFGGNLTWVAVRNLKDSRAVVDRVAEILEELYLADPSITAPLFAEISSLGVDLDTTPKAVQDALAAEFGTNWALSLRIGHLMQGKGLKIGQDAAALYETVTESDPLWPLIHGKVKPTYVEEIGEFFEMCRDLLTQVGEHLSTSMTVAQIITEVAKDTTLMDADTFAGYWGTPEGWNGYIQSQSSDMILGAAANAGVVKARNGALAQYLRANGYPEAYDPILNCTIGLMGIPQDVIAILTGQESNEAFIEQLQQSLGANGFEACMAAMTDYFMEPLSNGMTQAYIDGLGYYSLMWSLVNLTGFTSTNANVHWNELCDLVNLWSLLVQKKVTIEQLDALYAKLSGVSTTSVVVALIPGETSATILALPMFDTDVVRTVKKPSTLYLTLLNAWISTGTTGDVTYDRLLHNFFTLGTTGNAAVDSELIATLKSLNVEPLLESYMTGGTVGNQLVDDLLRKYFADGTAGIKNLDELIYEAMQDHEHVWSDWEVITEAGCMNGGEKTHSCRCGETESETVEALGHDWQTEQWEMNEDVHFHSCSRCDEITDEADHEGQWKIVTEATATQEGLEKLICTECGYEMDSRVIEQLPDESEEDKQADREMIAQMIRAIAAWYEKGNTASEESGIVVTTSGLTLYGDPDFLSAALTAEFGADWNALALTYASWGDHLLLNSSFFDDPKLSCTGYETELYNEVRRASEKAAGLLDVSAPQAVSEISSSLVGEVSEEEFVQYWLSTEPLRGYSVKASAAMVCARNFTLACYLENEGFPEVFELISGYATNNIPQDVVYAYSHHDQTFMNAMLNVLGNRAEDCSRVAEAYFQDSGEDALPVVDARAAYEMMRSISEIPFELDENAYWDAVERVISGDDDYLGGNIVENQVEQIVGQVPENAVWILALPEEFKCAVQAPADAVDTAVLTDSGYAPEMQGMVTTVTVEAPRNFAVNDQQYHTLDEAIENAQSGDTIVLLRNYTLPEGDYVIPEGVTLLIPFNSSHTVYRTSPGTSTAGFIVPTAYRTLTLAEGAKLVVKGELSVSATLNAETTSNGSTCGNCGWIRMKDDSSITVEAGGTLYAWGYITGQAKSGNHRAEGTVLVREGGKVYEPFQVRDWRGGNAALQMNNNSQQVFPVSQYYLQNVQVPMTLEAGASLSGHFDVETFNLGVKSANLSFFGTADSTAAFKIVSGSVTKNYDEDSDRLILSVDGECVFGSTSMRVFLLYSYISIDSSKYVFPLNGNITIDVREGSHAIVEEDVAMLPGSEVCVQEGGKISVEKDAKIIVYDRADWNGYCGHNNASILPCRYAFDRKTIRTAANMTDAAIRVGGVFDVSQGYLYTTSGGANIGSLFFDGEGTIRLREGNLTTTYQMTQVYNWDTNQSTLTYVSIPIKAPVLRNGNGTSVDAAAGEYLYRDGEWTCITQIEHSYEESVVRAPTCTEDGLLKRYCPVCGDENTETIPATGHTPGEPVTENEVEATCTTDGSYDTVVYCTVCEVELSRETAVISAAGHTPGEPVTENEVEATCTTDGSYDTVVYCTVCEAELSRETAVISAAGHTPGEPVRENEKNGDCTTGGSYDEVVYCGVCQEELNRETVNVPGTDHAYTVVVTPPTCNDAGYTTYTCSGCGYSYVTDQVAATGHTIVVDRPVEATCTSTGLTMGRHCTVCKQVLQAQIVTPMVDHEYDRGFCIECDCCEPAVYNQQTDVYEIGNAGQLYWFANKAVTEYWINGELTADIVVNYGTMTSSSSWARVWKGIGGNTEDTSYIGTFDGKGYTVSGLYSNSAQDCFGLFRYIGAGGTVKNVHVSKSYLSQAYSSSAELGGIAGYNEGLIMDCSYSGVLEGADYVGGIVGSNNGTVRNCRNTGTIMGKDYVGGITGLNTKEIQSCFNSGKLRSPDSTTRSYWGGVAGCNQSKARIVNCANTGLLEVATYSRPSYHGGISGMNYNRIENSFTTGEGWMAVTGENRGVHTNVYYLSGSYSESSDAVGMTSDQFASGEVAYLLNKGVTDGTQVWYQTIGTEKIPGFSGGTVYKNQTGGCSEESFTYSYANEQSEPVTGHLETVLPGKVPTCVEDGLTEGVYCQVCGETLTDQEVVSSTGHNFEGVYTEPDGTAPGYTTYTCTNCGDSYVEEDEAVEPVFVAEVEGIGYETLGEALMAAKDGQTIKLLMLPAEDDAVLFNKQVRIDLNGLSYTVRTADLWKQEKNADGTVTVYGLKIMGSNMTLGGDLSMNFAVSRSAVDQWIAAGYDLYMEVTKYYADRDPMVFKIDFDDWYIYDKSGTVYAAKYDGIAAKEMSDSIDVRICYGDGIALSTVRNDGVRAYVMRGLAGTTFDKGIAKRVVVDMLNYGAAAQLQFNYDVENLANSLLTPEQKALGSQGEASVTDDRVKGSNYMGSTLNLGVVLYLKMAFRGMTSDMYAVISYTDYKDRPVEYRVEGADCEISSSYGIVVVDSLVLSDYNQLVTCTVYNADGTVYGSASDSIASYVARDIAGGKANQVHWVILNFAQSARAYLENRT